MSRTLWGLPVVEVPDEKLRPPPTSMALCRSDYDELLQHVAENQLDLPGFAIPVLRRMAVTGTFTVPFEVDDTVARGTFRTRYSDGSTTDEPLHV